MILNEQRELCLNGWCFRLMLILQSLCWDERLRQRVHTFEWRLILSFSRGSSPEVPTYMFPPGNNHTQNNIITFI